MSLLLALPLTMMAQQKIAIVNSQEVMAGMSEVKVAEKKIQDLGKKYDADIKSMQDELQKKTEAFIKDRETLPEAIRTRRQQEIQDLQQRIQQSYGFMREQLQQEQQKLLAPIQAKVANALKKLADAEGCTYVLEAGMMLHTGAGAVDLTDKLKKALGVKATPKK